MAEKSIKKLEYTDIVSASVDTINNNFEALKIAIGTGNGGFANYASQIQDKINGFLTHSDEKDAQLANRIDNLVLNINKIEDDIKKLQTTINQIISGESNNSGESGSSTESQDENSDSSTDSESSDSDESSSENSAGE